MGNNRGSDALTYPILPNISAFSGSIEQTVPSYGVLIGKLSALNCWDFEILDPFERPLIKISSACLLTVTVL
jgi:hypothetical protein